MTLAESTTKLYSPQVLALATSLADWPWRASLPLQTTVRSRSCGSVLTLGIAVADDAIAEIGLKAQACAIGQASAAIFASHATGRTPEDIATVYGGIEAWLSGDGPLPDWPGFDAIAAARDYPARHGALLLPWQAASALLHSD